MASRERSSVGLRSGGAQHQKEPTRAIPERMLCCVPVGATVAGAPGKVLREPSWSWLAPWLCRGRVAQGGGGMRLLSLERWWVALQSLRGARSPRGRALSKPSVTGVWRSSVPVAAHAGRPLPAMHTPADGRVCSPRRLPCPHRGPYMPGRLRLASCAASVGS